MDIITREFRSSGQNSSLDHELAECWKYTVEKYDNGDKSVVRMSCKKSVVVVGVSLCDQNSSGHRRLKTHGGRTMTVPEQSFKSLVPEQSFKSLKFILIDSIFLSHPVLNPLVTKCISPSLVNYLFRKSRSL